MEKVCCGGFYLGEGLELDGRTLKATGGSSPVPDPEVADIGKVLGIVEDGAGVKYAPVEGGGSGLPDPSELADGTAMVAVNGEWKMQEGYGYTDAPAFEPITWDGDITDRPYIDMFGQIFYKISNDVFTSEQLIGSTIIYIDEEAETSEVIEDVTSDGNLCSFGYGLSGEAGSYMDGTLVVPEDGTYFSKYEGGFLKSLTAPPSVHKFDPALIPASGDYTVTFSLDEDGETYTCDKTLEEIFANSNNAKFVFEWNGGILHAITELVDPSAPLVHAAFIIFGSDTLQNFLVIYNDDGVSGSSTSYILTPD